MAWPITFLSKLPIHFILLNCWNQEIPINIFTLIINSTTSKYNYLKNCWNTHNILSPCWYLDPFTWMTQNSSFCRIPPVCGKHDWHFLALNNQVLWRFAKNCDLCAVSQKLKCWHVLHVMRYHLFKIKWILELNRLVNHKYVVPQQIAEKHYIGAVWQAFYHIHIRSKTPTYF